MEFKRPIGDDDPNGPVLAADGRLAPADGQGRRALSALSGSTGHPSDARLLIVDDQTENIRYLTRILTRTGYRRVYASTDPREALELYRAQEPDLVLLDLHMPGMDGIAVLRELRRMAEPGTYVPVVMLTGHDTPEARQQALGLGATDFIAKPFEVSEVLLRIRNLLQTRWLHCQLQEQNRDLEARVMERTRELDAAQIEILERLAGAAEFRDDNTGQHTHRVAVAAARLARAIGLGEPDIDLLMRAAPLHDVGKIGIPDRVLLKPGALAPEESEIMRKHTTIGAVILRGGRSDLIRMAEEIALSHHERWDGAGYPEGRAGDEIPLVARIVAVSDVFDALSHDRPYRQAWPMPRVVEQLARGRGTHFDPELVDAFVGGACLAP